MVEDLLWSHFWKFECPNRKNCGERRLEEKKKKLNSWLHCYKILILEYSHNQQEGKWVERRLDSIFVNSVKVVRFWFWHEAVNDALEIMAVYYIHFRLPYNKTTLLGNVPTFFYFGITLLPPKKKSYKLHVSWAQCVWMEKSLLALQL